MATMKKPTVTLPSGATGYSDTAHELFTAAVALYYRGGRVVELLDKEVAIIRPDMLQSRCERFCDLFAWRQIKGTSELKRSKMSGDVAKVMLSSIESRELLPHIEKISHCPVIVSNGAGKTKVLGYGHHPEHSIFITDEKPVEDVPLDEAVQSLKGLIEEFDFTTEGDYSRAVSTMILPGLHAGGWLEGENVPIEIAEANLSQSGKTFRQMCASLIYNGHLEAIVPRSGGVGSFDECISVALVKGNPFIQIDNVREMVDSPLLESILTTQNDIDVRVPIHGHIKASPRNHIFYITSNGAKTTTDLTNRALIVRITKKDESFEFKEYEEGDLSRHIRTNQAYYLGCVFAVIAAWVEAGCKRTKARGHDFKFFVRTMDWIVQNLFGCVPLLEGHKEAAQRMHTPGLSFFRLLSITICGDGNLGVDYTAMELAEIAIQNEIPVPNAPKHAEEMRVAKQIGMLRKRVFKTQETETMAIDNLFFTCKKKALMVNGVLDYGRWVYRFDDVDTLAVEELLMNEPGAELHDVKTEDKKVDDMFLTS